MTDVAVIFIELEPNFSITVEGKLLKTKIAIIFGPSVLIHKKFYCPFWVQEPKI